VKAKLRRNDFEAFHGAEHGDRRRYDPIAIKKRSANQAKGDDDLLQVLVDVAPLALEKKREKREHSAFTAVVGAQDEDEILDADDEYQCPDNEREDTVNVGWCCCEAILGLEAGLKSVKRTCPDVSKYDTECNE
jgi:hypothetical protein